MNIPRAKIYMLFYSVPYNETKRFGHFISTPTYHVLPPLNRYFLILLNPEIKLTAKHLAGGNFLAFSGAGTIQFSGRTKNTKNK